MEDKKRVPETHDLSETERAIFNLRSHETAIKKGGKDDPSPDYLEYCNFIKEVNNELSPIRAKIRRFLYGWKAE